MSTGIEETTDAAPPVAGGRGVPGLIPDWDFVKSSPPLQVRLDTVKARLTRARPRPPHAWITPVRSRPAWVVYFVFAPDGALTPAHQFTLGRLRDTGLALVVVCAAREPKQVPDKLSTWADALAWKGVSGYDFSGYTVALEAIAAYSPGADILVMNDSVYGPFQDLRAAMSRTRWELGGFTASSDTQNHLQSYAFVLKALTPRRLRHVRPAFPAGIAFEHVRDVRLWHEFRFARVATRHMRVGADWFSPGGYGQDPTLLKPFELLHAGFPFVKRSLLGKHRKLQAPEEVRAELDRLGHPV